MQTTMINTPNLKVSLSTGTEGPSYDPYSYDELTAETPKGTLVVHLGLAEWSEFNGIRFEHYNEGDWADAALVAHTGYTWRQLERFASRKNQYCPATANHRHNPYSMAGFPGETFEVCAACGQMLNSYFSRSAIE